MAFKIREELVGKRFLSVKSDGKLKVSKISEWEWRSGFVRAVSTKDYSNADITVLVEFDDTGWKSREYIKVHSVFQVFLVENSLAWVEREEPNISPHEGKWPALSFKPVVDKTDLYQQTKQRLVEFLSDRFIDIVDEKEISLYKEGDENRVSTVLSSPEVKRWVKRWTDYQDGQKILLTTPTVLLGYRVEVYRTEGTTQWYTAVIKAYNHTNKSLTLTDDTVLEEHNEDPTLIQMHLIGDGVVDSILNGVDVGVAQRRRPRSTVVKQNSKDGSLNSSGSRSSQNTSYSSTSKSGTANVRNLNSPTTTASSSTSNNTTSSSTSHASVCNTSSISNKSGTSKGRTSGTTSSVASSPTSTSSGIESTAKDNSSKGQNHRSSKTPQKRKSDKSEPPTKQNKKTAVTKCLKKSPSTDSVEEEQSPTVFSQTCNVIVERIEEENKRQNQVKERTKGKPPRLRDRADPIKKSDDVKSVVSSNEPEEESPKTSTAENVSVNLPQKATNSDEINKTNPDLSTVSTNDDKTCADSLSKKPVASSNTTEDSTTSIEANDNGKKDSSDQSSELLIKSSTQKTKTCAESNKSNDDSEEGLQPKSNLVHDPEIEKDTSSGHKPGVQNNDIPRLSPKKGSKQAKVNKKKDSIKQNQSENPSVSGETKVDDDSMYYKKQMLRAGGLSPNNSNSNISEGINVNISLTDQIAKRNKGNLSVNGDGKFNMPETAVSVESRVPNTSVQMHHPAQVELSTNLSRFQETVGERGDRQSAFSSVSRSNLSAVVNDERADSRASDSQLNLRHEDKRPGSRLDEIRSVRSSPGSSPLIIDKHDAVNPYRDPELMRKNTVQSNVPNILTTQQPAFPAVVHPGVTAPSQPSGAATVAFPPGVPGLPARSLLSSLPYSSAHPLPPSHPLSLPHGYTVDAMAAVRAQHQQLLLQQQQQQLMAAGFPSTHMATLEAIWQRKLPSNPLPQHWALSKNPEAILAGDYAALQREHILQLEQERERREHHDRREAERLEQERREKERKEQLERERIEKAEREKQEQERLERERLERERERMEKERRERERKEWEEHKQNQERILHPAEVDPLAAVDQHFAASLTKLANQQGITNMFPLARGRPGASFIPKTEPHQAHVTIPGMTYRQDPNHPFDPHKEEIRELDIAVSKSVSDNKPPFAAYHTASGYPTVSAGPPHSQKHVFSLYGFPSSPSTISTEQLKRGLIPDSRTVSVKDEMLDKKRSFSPHLMSGHPQPLPAGFSKTEIKREPAHSSVIVKRENKMKMEVPMAAHSHHNSPSSSSPRPQHPRPAHTPEHRPDRPLSSSASPASGIHSHLHHSNTATSGSAHLPHHSIGFRPSDSHISHRSQSPYTLVASQAHMPQPLDYCKSSMSSKSKAIDNVQQQQSAVHSTYQTQASVSLANTSSLAYNNSLIQQGLVPNPIYSHPSTQPSPQHHHHNPADPSIRHSSPTVVPGSKTSSQLSPTTSNNNKRKSGSKDSYNNVQQKRPKSHTPDVSAGTGGHHNLNPSVSIPVTTPQILSNPSPYTTTNSNVFHQPPAAVTAASVSTTMASTSSISPAVSSSSTPVHPSHNTGFLDSFRSFVENTVQEAFQQNEKKEAAERNKSTGSNNKPKVTSSPTDTNVQPLSSNVSAGGYGNCRREENTPQLPASSLSDSYNSRIMETINRVANNQMDTDSDTLSASSPPPQIKPSERNSPLNKSNSSSGSSHPHHMKKAWLQRHDEDKKSETPVFSNAAEEDSNSSLSHTKDIISCVENSSLTHGQESNSASPANVVVTLPNGNIGDLNHHDESTSSASESETQSPSKVFGPKKRVKQRKSGTASTTTKKLKTEPETIVPNSPAIVTTPLTSNSTATTSTSSNSTSNKKKTSASRRSKNEKDIKPKDEPVVKKDEPSTVSSPNPHEDHPEPSKEEKCSNKTTTSNSAQSAAVSRPVASSSPHSPHSERSIASPALSESNTASSVSSSSSSSNTTTSSTALSKTLNNSNSKENKDKKKKKGKDNKKSSSFNKPLVKQSVQTLKRTMAHFIQDGSCSEVTPKLTKCRECKMTPVQRSKKQPNIFCRFYAFRRLRYNPRGIVKIEGFSQLSDADPDDIEPWLPQYPIEEPYLDVESSKFIIAKVGDKFCELVEQEREAKSWAGEDVSIVWKRAVMGVREMCDVCDTTLFNMHWVCSKCGFVVCLDCYKARVKEGKKPLSEDKWLTCSSNRQAHDVSEMMLTQIIPSDALWELGRLIHDIRFKWSIPSNCPCPDNVENSSKSAPKNGINQQLLHAVNNHTLPNGIGSDVHNSEVSKSKKHTEPFDSYNPATTSSPLSILAEVASMDSESNRDKVDGKRKGDKNAGQGDEFLEGDKKGCSTLRELLTKTARKSKAPNDKKTKKGSSTSTLNDIIQSFVEKSCMDVGTPFKFLHYTPRLGGWKRELPIICHNLTETSVLYPDVPHSWLCDGRLLRLHDAHHKGNLQIFQDQWKRGQPVLVSCANKRMNVNMWKPEVFSKEFGRIENEVVNCRTGDVIIGHTMSDFWDGFQNVERRPLDSNGEPILLKLKDWPPGDDFSELLPSRFQDLMQALPLPEYTHRTGKFNLASRLPDFLVRPDLGPKMYNAYGSSQFPKEATTNLHLDISDAVNIMVYVGIPGETPTDRKSHEEAAVKAIDDADCDSITKKRVREVNEIPGALWHIYDAHDADKIRDFLNKVAKERGEIIENDHDAIHDQSWYIDKELSDRLYDEYGVQGYTIVQCHGDAIFIPAGAPHQVRNLHSCVKVAEDFVSPEHLNHCFRLTQEFRQLSDTHSNHEDKLQVKNIIYHAVKDAVAVLREHDPKDD